MGSVRILVLVTIGVVLAAESLAAQSLTRYRAYALGSSVPAIFESSGAHEADLRTVHERPARIQQLEWRAPYVAHESTVSDPVRNILFSFYDDQLYRIVVTYERQRMSGLTNEDVIQAVSTAFDAIPMHAGRGTIASADLPPEVTVVARWDDGASALTLVRAGYTREFQLILVSKQLSGRARDAITEAARLDTQEAPQRELDLRNKRAAEGVAVQEKARAVNKPAFKP